MREYVQDELRKLSHNVFQDNICLKQIPVDKIEGRLDPKVLKRVKKSMGKVSSEEFPSIDLIKLRESMGGENQDLTPKGSIYVEHKIIAINDYQITLTFFCRKDLMETTTRPFLFLHGGGYIGGSVKRLENQLKLLAYHSNYKVFAIDYRLAPENPYPSQLEDVLGTVEFLEENAELYHFDMNQLSIGGESAGGNLSLLLALKKTNISIKKQILIYPAGVLEPLNESKDWLHEHFNIPDLQQQEIESRMEKFISMGRYVYRLYCPEEKLDDPSVSPYYEDDLSDFPETLFILPEFDPYTAYTEDFIQKLENQHKTYQIIKYLGMDHGFFDRLGSCSQTEDMIIEMARFLG